MLRHNPHEPVADTLARLDELPPSALLTSAETSLYLAVRPDLLRTWRWQGRGPEFSGRGHFVRYRKRCLDAFLAGNGHGARLPRADATEHAGDFAGAVA